MGRGIKVLMAVQAVIYVVELAYAYAVGFDSARVDGALGWLWLDVDAVNSGWVWQLFTYMWLHNPDSVFHILVNLFVLWAFGPTMEAAWGTRRFVRNYLVYGLGGGVAIYLVGVVFAVFFDGRPPALGASGAVAGVVAAFCIEHWRAHMRVFFLDLTGRGLLIVFIIIDVVRLLLGEPIAVEGHWGGMLTAAALRRSDLFSPRLWQLRLRRWRLKRKLRVERGGDGRSNGDSRTLH
jgi:membrane associated rhomboid family serine protease